MDQATPAAASSITNITNTQVMGNQTNISLVLQPGASIGKVVQVHVNEAPRGAAEPSPTFDAQQPTEDLFKEYEPSFQADQEEATRRWDSVCGDKRKEILEELSKVHLQRTLLGKQLFTKQEWHYIEEQQAQGVSVSDHIYNLLSRLPRDDLDLFIQALGAYNPGLCATLRLNFSREDSRG